MGFWASLTNENANNQNNQAHGRLNVASGDAMGYGSALQQGLEGYNQGLGTALGNMQGTANYLQGEMEGKNSVSAEQLRQGLQQQYAQQRSMAASANPQNAAMAARTAAMNMGRAATGMAGNQAMAGIAERNAAAAQLGNLQQGIASTYLGARGQNISGANQAYGTGVQGYGIAVGNPYQTWEQQAAPLLSGVAGVGSALATKSDRNAKTDIEDGSGKAKALIDGLKSYTFTYKNPKDGAGTQIGVMAQDLEKHGAKQAVVNTPSGKMIHPGKLATANTAMIVELGKRLKALEGSRK